MVRCGSIHRNRAKVDRIETKMEHAATTHIANGPGVHDGSIKGAGGEGSVKMIAPWHAWPLSPPMLPATTRPIKQYRIVGSASQKAF
jgi:hypothetical protein